MEIEFAIPNLSDLRAGRWAAVVAVPMMNTEKVPGSKVVGRRHEQYHPIVRVNGSFNATSDATAFKRDWYGYKWWFSTRTNLNIECGLKRGMTGSRDLPIINLGWTLDETVMRRAIFKNAILDKGKKVRTPLFL